MSFKAYWDRLILRNKSLQDDETKMTISVASFRKQIEKAYSAGVEDTEQSDDAVNSLFGKIFGRRD